MFSENLVKENLMEYSLSLETTEKGLFENLRKNCFYKKLMQYIKKNSMACSYVTYLSQGFVCFEVNKASKKYPIQL